MTTGRRRRQSAAVEIFSTCDRLFLVGMRPIAYSFSSRSSVSLMRNGSLAGSSATIDVTLVTRPQILLYLQGRRAKESVPLPSRRPRQRAGVSTADCPNRT